MDNDSLERQFLEGFQQFGKMITRASQLCEAKVKSVDETKYTCVVTIKTGDTETDINNVPLKVLISTQASFIEIPKVGSICTLLFRHNNIQCPQLLHVNECDKVVTKIETTIFEVTKDGFKLNNDANGLKDTLKNLINELIAFKTVSPGGNGVTDPTTITNLQGYLSDLDKYLTD